MSKLRLHAPALGKTFDLNVTAFSSALVAQISSVQTKTKLQHFPVKAQQPDVTFDLVFRSEPEFEDFWKFVRRHQLAAIKDNPNPEVVLNWPQRGINDWTGVIKQFRGGGARRNPTPRARLVVDLIDSVYSARTQAASAGVSFWNAVAGYGSYNGVMTLPSQAENQVLGQMSLETMYPQLKGSQQ